jgi:hypothetical protein
MDHDDIRPLLARTPRPRHEPRKARVTRRVQERPRVRLLAVTPTSILPPVTRYSRPASKPSRTSSCSGRRETECAVAIDATVELPPPALLASPALPLVHLNLHHHKHPPELPKPPNDPHGEHPRLSSAVHGRRSTALPFPIAGTSSDPSKHQNRTLGEQGPLPHPFPAKSGRLRPSIPPSAMHSSAQGPHCFFSVLSRDFSINQGPLRNLV